MNPQTPTNEHLLLIRGTHWNHGMSPAELQRVMSDFYAWVEGLNQGGVLRGAQPLMEEGKLVTGANGAVVRDGAFAEAKEAIAGYFLLAVPTMDEALRIAHGGSIDLAHSEEDWTEFRVVVRVARLSGIQRYEIQAGSPRGSVARTSPAEAPAPT